jgi:hypothetical protein
VQRLSSAVGTAVLGLVAAVAVYGCQAKPKPMAPPPPAPAMATPDQVVATQQQFAAVDPHTKVGHVVKADPASHLAVVSGIAFADAKVGDPISFTGLDQQPFANGTITDLDNHTDKNFSFLIVDYQKASPNGRDPAAGDLAVLIPMGR